MVSPLLASIRRRPAPGTGTRRPCSLAAPCAAACARSLGRVLERAEMDHALARHQRAARDRLALDPQRFAFADRREGRKRRGLDVLEEPANGLLHGRQRARLRLLYRVEGIAADELSHELAERVGRVE